MIREVHGVANVFATASGDPPDRMRVFVEDGAGWVYLRTTRTNDAALTVPEARMLARELVASAQRVEEAAKAKAPERRG